MVTSVEEALPLEVAITVDELLLWDDAPMPEGYTREKVVTSVIETLAKHQINGVYGFAHTSPLDNDSGLKEILRHWVDSGHHLGNHTHCHACLNWVSAKNYCEDIERSEDVIGELIERAPGRYFRYAMDMSGDSAAKRGEVEDFLAKKGYTNAPISAWFNDFAWIVPHTRSHLNGDKESLTMLRQSYVEAAVAQLREAAKAARLVFGRDIPHIWLIHGTPIAMDTLDDILTAFKRLGVRFVSLDHAMKDVAHRAMPQVSPKFVNQLQRFCLGQGISIDKMIPSMLHAVLQASPREGMDSIALYENLLRGLCERAGGKYEWAWA